MRLALIVGSGSLPAVLARDCAAAGHDLRIAALDGQDPCGMADWPVQRFRLETLGSLIAGLRDWGAEGVCFAGGIVRPPLDMARVDAATAAMLPALAGALVQGDDGALRAVLALFQQAGIPPLAATDLVPDLLPPEGVLAGPAPGDAMRRDASRGQAVLTAMGSADLGQGCVVAGGQVLAVEALPGTEWTLRSVALLRSAGTPKVPEGGVLMKAPKPGQDRRVDLPAIGPETVAQVVDAGLRGIVVEAGGVMVLERAETVARARAANVTLWVRGAV
ncbi:hypothetical protein OCGS_2341 [Oceaniovalibus guishaninsula JLT2003]|uniref:Phosphatidate cytidyltransferase n=1 Tax=Oceaniovalibus guishaninsula JLT2003 TaxID=1231392 RepID=K2HL51_9RHOB|nr:UDP-2,3-diacylglucosamine diphosphatase LpxI [Oceaniovalibus guishaninsula]EKE43609.1 hypothetical protein OCGS_2341 [Oceaniovalibus guishaninsula JLT2003]